MATCTIIDIPKTKSAAADPSARSFLTTLPPEIRNPIYEYVFKRDEPVLPRDDHVFLENFRYESSIDCRQRIVDKGFRHGLSGCVGLLLSCRQVYHEAVGILYGQNHFMFSHCPKQQITSTCKWLVSIGSNYELLSRVSIDADGIGITSGAYDLLPLLKLIWNHPQTKCRFAFASSGLLLADGWNTYAPSIDGVPPSAFLNGVLFALGTTDALGLKQYAISSRLMSSITFCYGDFGSIYGYVKHTDRDIKHHLPHTRREFDILDHGSKVQWKESKQLSFLSLPPVLLSAINAYAKSSDTGIVFDLDKKKVRGYYAGLSRVNNFLRYDIDRMTTRVYNKLVIRMSTQKTTTDFDSFRALQEWFVIQRFASLLNWKCSIAMILKFKLPTAKPAADLRIDISKLLHLFAHDDSELIITVQGIDSSRSHTCCIMWHDLRRAVFLLLSDLLLSFPSKAYAPLPPIWINGHGTVLCAKYPATISSEEKTIPYPYTVEGPANIREQICRKIESVAQSGRDDHRREPGNGELEDAESLADMWYYFRDYLWWTDCLWRTSEWESIE